MGMTLPCHLKSADGRRCRLGERHPGVCQFDYAAPHPNEMRASMKAAGDPKRDPNHTDDQLIEEIKGPSWLIDVLSVERPEILRALAPKELDETDTFFVLNALRVYAETNRSLRQRLAAKKLDYKRLKKAAKKGVERVDRIREILRLIANA